MKALSSMTIFLCSSSRRLFPRATPLLLFKPESGTLVGISQFSTLSTDAPASSSSHSSSRRNSEDNRNVRVSVWWNFDNCPVPPNADDRKVSRFIMAAVRANGIKGPIEITAYGDSSTNLYSTGISVRRVSHVTRNTVDKKLLEGLMNWVSCNPPPAHIFLISGAGHFARYLHRLKMSNYNILLASTDNAPASLCSAASIMWQWTALVKGENLSGKYFNRPPSGSFGSWYVYYRVPIEDQLVVFDQSSCLQSGKIWRYGQFVEQRIGPKNYESPVGISKFSTLSTNAPNVGVSVWWDLDSCSGPPNADIHNVPQSITDVLRANGIMGPFEIRAFGNIHRLFRSKQEALYSAGINVTHVPHGRKSRVTSSLLAGLHSWCNRNPPPAHLFLISVDPNFAPFLHRLRMNNYNILLACTDNAPAVLCSAASIKWQWTALVKGENLSGKYFNQPPDGPFDSWYGQYDVPLEDPFVVPNKSSCLQLEEVSDSNSNTKRRPVPMPGMTTGSGTSIKDSVPVTASKENSGHNLSMPPREETSSSPSELDMSKLSTDSEAPPGKWEEQ